MGNEGVKESIYPEDQAPSGPASVLNDCIAVAGIRSTRHASRLKRKAADARREDGADQAKRHQDLPVPGLFQDHEHISVITRGQLSTTVRSKTPFNRPPTDRLSIYVFEAGGQARASHSREISD